VKPSDWPLDYPGLTVVSQSGIFGDALEEVSSRITANSGPSSVVSQNARNPSALGNSETYRSPARRKFAAAIADPDGDKRFPLLSVRSLRAVTSQPPVQPEKAMHDSRAKNENVQ
jgi:hypothetical protein